MEVTAQLIKEVERINQQERAKHVAEFLSHLETIQALDQTKKSDMTDHHYSKMQQSKLQKTYRKTRDLNSLDPEQQPSYPTYSTADSLVSTNQIGAEYLKSWGLLDKQQKINRLMAYILELNLPEDELVQLRSLLITAVHERLITRKDDVNYCVETGKVLKINGLKQNQETRQFYIGKDISKVKVVHTANNLKPVKKLDLKGLKPKLTLKLTKS